MEAYPERMQVFSVVTLQLMAGAQNTLSLDSSDGQQKTLSFQVSENSVFSNLVSTSLCLTSQEYGPDSEKPLARRTGVEVVGFSDHLG